LEKIGGLEVVDCGAFDMPAVEMGEGVLEAGGGALDAGVGPHESLKLQAGHGVGLRYRCSLGQKAYPGG
jgi:hypothetical protein